MFKKGQWLTGDFTDVPKKEEHGLMAILLNFNQLREPVSIMSVGTGDQLGSL